mmetsp:Transcript_44377/g.105676  ORF Transcript_44377/g.105676 Transcript_44377/m.105676 type:complete len:90 (-) Transcript_44377:30-299(-)
MEAAAKWVAEDGELAACCAVAVALSAGVLTWPPVPARKALPAATPARPTAAPTAAPHLLEAILRGGGKPEETAAKGILKIRLHNSLAVL